MRVLLVALAASFVALGCSSHASAPATPNASQTPDSPERRHCLSIARIYRTQIVDDGTILFHMRDGAVFKNELPQRCYGLRIQNGFGYATPLDRVCDVDIIQVIGGSLSRCRLGTFEQIEGPTDLLESNLDTAPSKGRPRDTKKGSS